jgi:hypothetical protein
MLGPRIDKDSRISLLPEAKAIEVARLSNEADESWTYVAEKLEGNDRGLWIVRVYDEYGEELPPL